MAEGESSLVTDCGHITTPLSAIAAGPDGNLWFTNQNNNSIGRITPAGVVTVKVPAGTRAGQELRLSGRGMKRGAGAPGHLHAVVRIDVPTVVDDKQKALYQELADTSNFNPRAQLEREAQ